MTAATYFDFPRERRSWWSFAMELIGLVEAPRPALRRQPAPAYEPKFGDADVRALSEEPTPALDYRPTTVPFDSPAAEPVADEPPPAPTRTVFKIDPIDDLKRTLRTLSYGEFVTAANGMGCSPKKLWAWATDSGEAA